MSRRLLLPLAAVVLYRLSLLSVQAPCLQVVPCNSDSVVADAWPAADAYCCCIRCCLAASGLQVLRWLGRLPAAGISCASRCSLGVWCCLSLVALAVCCSCLLQQQQQQQPQLAVPLGESISRHRRRGVTAMPLVSRRCCSPHQQQQQRRGGIREGSTRETLPIRTLGSASERRRDRSGQSLAHPSSFSL